jgi:hypothetical protein
VVVARIVGPSITLNAAADWETLSLDGRREIISAAKVLAP